MQSRKSKLKIIFFGTPAFVLPVVESIKQSFDLVGIVTTPDTIQGRKKILTPSPVKEYGQTNNIPVFTFQQFNTETATQLIVLQPDLFVVAAYGRIIPLSIINIPKYGAVNIHPSLLPKYRGPSPIQSALLNGDGKTGVTLIKIDEKMDHGPVLIQWAIDLTPTDTFANLHASMFEEAAERLSQAITDYTTGKIQPKPQDDAKATFCSLITRESGYFDYNNPPSTVQLDRMVRAYFPWPNAWTKINTKNDVDRIVKLLPENKIQFEGGKVMPIEDAVNGYPELGEFFKRLRRN